VSAIDHYQSDITLIGQSSSAWGARSWVTVWVIDSAAKLAMTPMTVVTVGTRADPGDGGLGLRVDANNGDMPTPPRADDLRARRP
jgi:hypothetical protein